MIRLQEGELNKMAIDPTMVASASAQVKQAARAVSETPSLSDHLDRLEHAISNVAAHVERLSELLDMPHKGVLSGTSESQSDTPQASPTLAERQGQRVSVLEFHAHNLASSLAQMTQEAERLR